MSRGLLGVVVPPAHWPRVPRGGGGTAGASCRKGLVEPPTSIESPADGTQLAGSFRLVAAKSPPLGAKPRRPEFELAHVRGVIPAPLRDPVSSQVANLSLAVPPLEL